MLDDTIKSKQQNIGECCFREICLFVMQGCDQPLIVRFADPKKPRIEDSRFKPAPPNKKNILIVLLNFI